MNMVIRGLESNQIYIKLCGICDQSLSMRPMSQQWRRIETLNDSFEDFVFAIIEVIIDLIGLIEATEGLTELFQLLAIILNFYEILGETLELFEY